jgi:N-dimethylarginine dimethylaminohydrolase
MTEEQLATHLSKLNNFNLIEALKEGYSFREIISYLAIKETNQDKHLELIMCPPKYMSAEIPNNVWMRKLDESEREVNVDKAMAQFFDMYNLFSNDAFVYLLPPKEGLQDQVYVTNAAAILPHLYRTAVLARFRAEGRPGEEGEVAKLLQMMEFNLISPPSFFEGEAELKWLRENIYVGGYGIRTDIKTLDWMEETFGMQIIKLKETDDKRYHLDCNVFPLSRSKIITSKDILDPQTTRQLEAVAEIIPVSKRDSQFSITNNLRIGSIIYTGTDISELKKEDDHYLPEKEKNERLEEICRDAGLELVFINLSEFSKSGAALSCCVLHASYIGYPS